MDEFRKLLGQVMRRDGVAAVEYGEIAGYRPLRATLAQVLASQGIQTDADSILITAGSQQALSLVTGLILSPGEAVVVEGPTYAGALDVFRSRGLRILTVGVDEEGMDMRELEAVLSCHRPGLIYTIPNFHNPTGACLDGQRRRQLISLAGRFDVPILEDDYVGDIRYEGRAQPTLKSLDPDGRVIYMSTFSKMLMPWPARGLRGGRRPGPCPSAARQTLPRPGHLQPDPAGAQGLRVRGPLSRPPATLLHALPTSPGRHARGPWEAHAGRHELDAA